MVAALQQTPITFQSRSPPSAQSPSRPTVEFSLSSNLKPPKLTPGLSSATAVAAAAHPAPAWPTPPPPPVATPTPSPTWPDPTTPSNRPPLMRKSSISYSPMRRCSFFTNPTIAEEAKREVVDEIAKSSAMQPHMASFLNILVDMKRIDLIKGIVKEFDLVYNALTEMELSLVTSVVSLEAQHLAQIAKEVQKLTGRKNVGIKMVIDQAVVAGFTIRYGNSGSKLIDMSVKKQLEEIATELDLGDIQLVV
ncbi:ATP synthase delta chain chloroplastic [Phtheirospermum japonicum]|uniref:ATP synthase delta chain chloroplastic n=1 Tax=Phtheirospermum japonicum TaxID=374723 RepID=A0A830BKP6_9LAMI|nr:ATP synthase delta chain chloroplastic [Phtheirospermum japonicum]